MWAFLSTRLRTWLLFAIAVPVVRFVVNRVARREQQARPGARSTKALVRADSTITSLAERRKGRRAKYAR